MRRALLLLSLVSGCAVDPCSDKSGTCIALEIRAGAGVPSTVRQIGVRMLSGFSFIDGGGESLRPEVEKPTSLPAFIAILPPAQFQGGDYSLEVNGYVNGERVGTATAEAAIDLKAKKRLTVTLVGAVTPDDGGAGDDGPPGVCDPVKQTGCAANQKCTADIMGGALSCVADRATKLGDECAMFPTVPVPATDPCQKSLWCVPDLQSGLFFSCRQFCSTDADCTQGAVVDADNKGRCVLKLPSANKHKFCTQACDPTINGSGDCVVLGTSCRVTVDGTTEYTNCDGERGTAEEGMPCAAANCEDGLTCFKGRCRKPCVIKSPVCLGGTTCTAPFAGAKPYGFCCPGGSC
jgi:hypothetical protein